MLIYDFLFLNQNKCECVKVISYQVLPVVVKCLDPLGTMLKRVFRSMNVNVNERTRCLNFGKTILRSIFQEWNKNATSVFASLLLIYLFLKKHWIVVAPGTPTIYIFILLILQVKQANFLAILEQAAGTYCLARMAWECPHTQQATKMSWGPRGYNISNSVFA